VPGSAFFTSNLTVTASAFAATNPTDELVASGLSTVKFAGTCLVSLNQNRTWRFLLRPAFAYQPERFLPLPTWQNQLTGVGYSW
jgi:hypothetical protein